MPTQVNTTTNTVTLQNLNQIITVVDNNNGNNVEVTQPLVNVIEVATPGPQGPQGPQGPIGPSGSFPPTGSFATTGSNIFTGTQTVTGSVFVSGSVTATSFTGSLQGTSSWANNATTSSYILQAVSASFASTASFVNPLTQSVSISGSLDVNGTGMYRDVLTIQKTGNTPGILLQESSAGGPYAPIIQFRTIDAFNQVQISSIRGEYQGSAPQTLLLSAPTFGYVAFGGSGQPGEYPVSINTYPYGVNVAPNNFVQRISTTENSAVGLIIKNQTIQSPNPTGNFLEFRNANNTVLSAVTSGGSFLIGTSTTSSLKLDVSGSTRIQGDTTITGSVLGNVVALSVSSNTASLNLSLGSFYTLQLTQSTNTFINPTNIRAGETVSLLVSTTGSATVSFPSIVLQPSGSSYVPTTTTGKDVLTFISFDNTNLYLASVKNLI